MPSPPTSRIQGLPAGCRRLAARLGRAARRLRGLPSSGRRAGVVVMLHAGRCGSTVLADMLARHPGILWDGKLPRRGRELFGAECLRRMDHLAWIRRQFAMSGRRHYGFEFKLMDHQYPAILGTTCEEFLAGCEAIGVTRYVLLTRRNAIHQLISDYTSRARARWHYRDDHAITAPKVRIDPSEVIALEAPGVPIVRYLEDLDRSHRRVRERLSGRPLLELEYERDILESGPDVAFRRVCEFLDIQAIERSPSYRKINPKRPECCVENWDELADAIRGTRFEWMLAPPRQATP